MDMLGILKLCLDWWKQREIIKIRIPQKVDYKVIIAKQKLVVYLGLEFRRSGGREIRYITRVILKPDEQLYSELQQHFKLPKEGEIEINNRVKLPRDEIVPLYKPELANYPEFMAISGIRENQLEGIQTVADNLSLKTLKVRLVWDDDGKKTKWKKISEEDYGGWV